MKYWNNKLKNMTEYLPGEQPRDIDSFIKLNTNENPFPPSKVVLDAMRDACNESLRLYPDPTTQSVRNIFSEDNGLAPDNIFIGNGSDEIFTLIFRGFIDQQGLAAFPYPSYSLYYTLAEANGIKYEKINLDNNLCLNLENFLKKRYELIIISNPNNPTGTSCSVDEIDNFLKRFNGLLVVDEAYVDFYGETAIELINYYDNIIITRSLSKSYSLAGLRIGIAAAHKDIIRGFLRLKDSYNINRVAEAGARAALLNKKDYKQNIEQLRINKEYLEKSLSKLGFEIIPSKTNFLFVKHPQIQSKDIYRLLKERKILVRFLDGPIQSDYVRITVGTMNEIKSMIEALLAIFRG